jgi:hypothetical protein
MMRLCCSVMKDAAQRDSPGKEVHTLHRVVIKVDSCNDRRYREREFGSSSAWKAVGTIIHREPDTAEPKPRCAPSNRMNGGFPAPPNSGNRHFTVVIGIFFR